jgi:hypothetical protein
MNTTKLFETLKELRDAIKSTVNLEDCGHANGVSLRLVDAVKRADKVISDNNKYQYTKIVSAGKTTIYRWKNDKCECFVNTNEWVAASCLRGSYEKDITKTEAKSFYPEAFD